MEGTEGVGGGKAEVDEIIEVMGRQGENNQRVHEVINEVPVNMRVSHVSEYDQPAL